MKAKEQFSLNLKLVQQFWSWFECNQGNFGDKFENVALIKQLDKWVSELGPFTWEIGPGSIKENLFVISPGGLMELLPLTKEIVSFSSNLKRWEIYYAKPPKEWNYIFNFLNSGGGKISIDASKWQYVLLRYDDGMFGIIIEAPNLTGLGEEEKVSIVEVFLESVIGEEVMMLAICEIEIVDHLADEYVSKASDAINLAKHLNQFFAKN